MTRSTKLLARIAGLMVGCAACAALLFAGRVPAHDGIPAAQLKLRSDSTGALAVRPEEGFLRARALRPGRAVRSVLSVKSLSSSALAVRLRALPAHADLDDLLMTEVSSGDELVFRGRLGRLRRWTRRSFELRPGQAKRLAVRAWLPPTASGYEFRLADVTLEWHVEAA